jgi:hypothetical protein
MSELKNQMPDCRCGHPSTAHSEDPSGKEWTGTRPMACVRLGCGCHGYDPSEDELAKLDRP